MCWNEICRDLTAVNETVSEWSAGTPMSDMEKDIVLEKLRTVYSQIKWAQSREVCPPLAPEVIADEGDDVPCGTEHVRPDAGRCATANILSDAGKKRKALLSLYDQETVEEEVVPASQNAKNEYSAVPAGEPGGQTLGEAYAHNERHHNISSELNCAHLDTLNGAIGINDKFMMIRDLFEGDTAAYEAAMQTLESFHDLDDAMVYIYENYNWDPDSAGVTMLVDLLTRKLA